MVLEKLTDMCRKIKLDHPLTPHIRISAKCIKDLNVRPEAIKTLEENISSKISDISCSNIFSYISSQARETKKIKNKWDYIKLKSFYMAKKTINKIKKKKPT